MIKGNYTTTTHTIFEGHTVLISKEVFVTLFTNKVSQAAVYSQAVEVLTRHFTFTVIAQTSAGVSPFLSFI